jgi:hypothetical protein
VPGWLIIPTLDIPEKTSLISQYAFGSYGPLTSFIALRHVLSKSCALCTAPEISRISCSPNPLSSSHWARDEGNEAKSDADFGQVPRLRVEDGTM